MKNVSEHSDIETSDFALTGEQVGEVVYETRRAEELEVRPVSRVGVEDTSTDGVGLGRRDTLPSEEVGDWVGERTKYVGAEVGQSGSEVKRVGCDVRKGAGGGVDGVRRAEEDVVCGRTRQLASHNISHHLKRTLHVLTDIFVNDKRRNALGAQF